MILTRLEVNWKQLECWCEKYDETKEEQKRDQDQGQYVDEYRERIKDAFKNFKINNKVVDIAKLSKETDPKDIFNDIVLK